MAYSPDTTLDIKSTFAPRGRLDPDICLFALQGTQSLCWIILARYILTLDGHRPSLSTFFDLIRFLMVLFITMRTLMECVWCLYMVQGKTIKSTVRYIYINSKSHQGGRERHFQEKLVHVKAFSFSKLLQILHFHEIKVFMLSEWRNAYKAMRDSIQSTCLHLTVASFEITEANSPAAYDVGTVETVERLHMTK